MSAQPPLERLLGVPDLVENVFLRLDPASRRAFFQAHRHVAQNGLVLAHTKLQIELTPLSLQDQWQRVLRLTRSQPLRCLVLAWPNRKRLQDFLRCVPRGRSEEKQRVLQGMEVQLQVPIKLETGGVPRLQDLLRSWRNEQQAGVEDTRVQLVLDLCGREFVVNTDLALPCCCTLKNGTLQLPGTSCVRAANEGVRLESIVARGTGTQETVVHVGSGGSLVMEGCRVEGGSVDETNDIYYGGAVRVGGAEASLCAQRCSMQSSKGSGLVVCAGGRATLEYVTASNCGWDGILVDGEDSMVSAAHCHMDGNSASNAFVHEGAYCCLRHCSSDGSREGAGWNIGPGSRLVASDSSASSNERCGAVVSEGSASLLRVTTSSNGGSGLLVHEGGSLEACDSETSNNKHSGALCVGQSSVSLQRVNACSNGGDGWDVRDQGSSLVVTDSSACNNEMSGAAVTNGASSSLFQVTTSSNGDNGWEVRRQASGLVVTDSSACNNKECGAVVSEGSASLLRVTTSLNGGNGLQACKGGILEASDSETSSNKLSGAFCVGGASISLCRVTANSNWGYGWGVSGQGSRLEAKTCQAQHNSLGNTSEALDGCIICLGA